MRDKESLIMLLCRTVILHTSSKIPSISVNCVRVILGPPNWTMQKFPLYGICNGDSRNTSAVVVASFPARSRPFASGSFVTV